MSSADVERRERATAEIIQRQRETVETLEAKYKEESALRKRYFNQIEDRKGKIRVFARTRPLSEKEKKENQAFSLAFPDAFTMEHPWRDERAPRSYAFDRAFGADASQAEVFEDTKHLVQSAFDGYNVCIFAYGQTGSGKTHTMFGTDADDKLGSAETAGIVPRACEEILNAVRRRSTDAGGGIVWSLKASYVEVYGQDVFDLLKGGARVGQSRVASRRYVADGDASVDVRTAEDIARVLRTGDAQKRRAATAMNDRSSRAHAVFSLTLVQTMDEVKKENGDGARETSEMSISARQLRSRLCLVDLGGSEKLTKSRANEGSLETPYEP